MIEAIEEIPDEKFTQTVSQSVPGKHQRIQCLLDEIIFFVNQYHPITYDQGTKLDDFIREIKHIFGTLLPDNNTMQTEIRNLHSPVDTFQHQVQSLQTVQNEKKKLRTVVETLTPLVKEIRCSMLDEQIPESYYSKSMPRACLLRAENQTISSEIACYNRDNPQSTFSIDLFNQFESIIRFQTNALRIDYITSLNYY